MRLLTAFDAIVARRFVDARERDAAARGLIRAKAAAATLPNQLAFAP